MKSRVSLTRITGLTLLSLALSVPALAQDDPPSPGEDEALPTPEELGWIPNFRVVGFQDRPGSDDCDRAYARYGDCIEIVDFVPYEPIVNQLPVWSNKEKWKEALAEQEDAAGRRQLRREKREVFTRWRAMSELNAQMWEDMVYRWQTEDDGGIAALKASGYEVFPQATAQWDLTYPGDQNRTHVFSMPEHDRWIQGSEWLEPFYSQIPDYDLNNPSDAIDSDGDGLSDARESALGTFLNIADSDRDGFSDFEEVTAETAPLDPNDWPQKVVEGEQPFYRLVKYALPDGQEAEPPSTAILAGRFALRLGVDGRLHDYDLMDADPKPSGPFFEQMFPYDNIYRGVSNDERDKYIPLVNFDRPDTHLIRGAFAENSMPVNNYIETLEQAGREFNRFYRLVGSQIAQFAMEDYTVNHMRILGALTMMRSPPGSRAGIGKIARNLNPGGEGETDPDSEIQARVDNSVYSIRGGFALSYNKLPETILNEWIGRLAITHPPDDEYYRRLFRQVRALLNDTIRPSAAPIEALSDTYLEDWIRENREGGDLSLMRLQIKQLAMQLLMDELSQSERDRVETYLLLDQLDESIYLQLDPQVDITPGDMAGLTSDSWQGVLEQHNYSTAQISQGLGAVDPTSICSTREGTDALGEPTVGVSNLDILFAATDNYFLPPSERLTEDALLWEARETIPFMMLDNPVINDPDLVRLVGLPDGLALYRARWTIWSGWHFFWHVEQFAKELRLVLRTGAICEDTVLAPPDLVATIVRAGMLDGDFRPTEAARIWDDLDRKRRRRERRARRNPNDAVSTDEAAAQAQRERALARTTRTEVDYLRNEAQNPDASTADQLAQTGLGLFGKEKEEQPRLATVEDFPESVTYIRKIVRDPLERIAAEEQGLIVSVFDSTEAEPFYGLRNLRPRTPYARNQRRAHWRGWVRSANWAVYLDQDPESQTVTQVSPSYDPTPSVETNVIVPRWKRNKTWDANFMGGVGFFPVRQTQYTCNPDAITQNGVVRPCDPGDYQDLFGFSSESLGLADRTEGFSVDFSSMATWWLWDEPRIALEMGLEVRADMIPGGESWFHQDYNTANNGSSPDYSFVFRPQGGAIFGLRQAPDPGPMSRFIRRKPTWGANAPDGSSYQGRWEYGIRTGFLVGPGYNGMEGT
ncbi:MAG: thrombospondin type 3 repeat-containing protein, partial [Myxococcota bacterium]